MLGLDAHQSIGDRSVLKRLRLPAFDVLRAGAATLVFLFHYAGFAAPYTSGVGLIDAFEWLTGRCGSVGTNLLLLLSGFFIAQSVASGRFSYFRFVWLRGVRILVPYIAVASLAIGFAHVFPHLSTSAMRAASLSGALAQVLPFSAAGAGRPVLTVAWTLTYILAGYLVLPVIAFALRRAKFGPLGRSAAWGAVTAVMFVCGLLGGTPPIRFCYIPAGCLLFELQAHREWTIAKPRTLQLLAVGSLVSLIVRVGVEVGIVGPLWPAPLRTGLFTGSGLVLVSSVIGLALWLQRRYEQNIREGNLGLSLVAGYGRTGYSFYLLHGPVVKLFAMLFFPFLAAKGVPAASYWLAMPFCWLAAAAGALLMYRTVEKPCRYLVMKEWDRATGSNLAGRAVEGHKPGEERSPVPASATAFR